MWWVGDERGTKKRLTVVPKSIDSRTESIWNTFAFLSLWGADIIDAYLHISYILSFESKIFRILSQYRERKRTHIWWENRKNEIVFQRNCNWHSVWTTAGNDVYYIIISMESRSRGTRVILPVSKRTYAGCWVTFEISNEWQKLIKSSIFQKQLHPPRSLSFCMCLWANVFETHSLPINEKRKTISVQIYAWHWFWLVCSQFKIGQKIFLPFLVCVVRKIDGHWR